MKKNILLIALLIISIIGFSFVNTFAASEISNAKSYSIGKNVSGGITDNNKVNTYSFKLNESGKIDINFTGYIEYAALKLYDENGKEIWNNTPHWNGTTEQISFQQDLYLCKGMYYFSVSEHWGRRGDFDFIINFTSADESFTEIQNGSNNKINSASSISMSQNYNGQIALNDNVDIYSFNLTSSGKININFTGYMEYVALKLYDESGKEIWNNTPHWNGTTEQISFQQDLYLCKGMYYFSVSEHWGRRGNFSFIINFTSANESFTEIQNGSNNKINSANSIAMNQKYNGQIALNDNVDIYKINITSGTSLYVDAYAEYIALKLYDATGKELWGKTPYWNGTTEQINFNEKLNLNNGTYYFSVSEHWGRRGNYTFYFTNGGAVTDASNNSDGIKVTLNGNKINFDQQPVLENGRTLVPLRAIFEALGATVEWNQATETVTSKKDNITITLTIGSNQLYVNGKATTLDVPAKVVNGRTLVPVRAVSESFKCKVDWEESSQTVIITK